jgi:hypothetical protein
MADLLLAMRPGNRIFDPHVVRPPTPVVWAYRQKTGTLTINHMTGVKVASRRIREEVLATGGGYPWP